MSDVKAVLNSDSTLKAVINSNGSIAKSVLVNGSTITGVINNGVTIYNRVNGGTYIHFDVTTDGIDQVFTSPDLSQYSLETMINLFKNGVNLEPSSFEKISANSIRISSYLFAGDTVDILATGSARNGIQPSGLNTQIQFNDNDEFAGSTNLVFDKTSNTFTTVNIAGANVSATNGNFTNLSGTLGTSSNNQPNITNVGTLLTLNVTGIGTFGNSVSVNGSLSSNSNLTVSGTSQLNGNTTIVGGSVKSVKEPTTIVNASIAATQNIDVITSSLYYFTVASAQNTTINFRGNSSTTMNDTLAIGESITVGVIATNNSTPFMINAFQIDGATVIPKFLNAPFSASTTGLNVYVFTIIKTAANVYTVIANKGSTV